MGIEELIVAMAKHEGLKEGQKKAEAQANRKALTEKKAMAREMKKDKLPMEQIAKFTKLPLETIQAL
jgi:uncharacterized protein YpbB